MSAAAKLWTLGKTWNVHARAEDGCWIRVTGIATDIEAKWEARCLVDDLNRPHPHLAASLHTEATQQENRA